MSATASQAGGPPLDLSQVPCLPLWEWLEKAICDLQRCEQDSETYCIRMDHWHQPSVYGECWVCLAGSLLAQTFHVSPQYTVHPNYGRDKPYSHLLHAIDSLRTGAILEALRDAQHSPLITDYCRNTMRTILDNAEDFPPDWEEREVAEYLPDRKQFFQDMLAVVERLRELGV